MPWEKRPQVEQGTEMGLLAERTGLFPTRQVALLAPPGPPLCAPAVCKQVPTKLQPCSPQWASLGLPPASQDGER